jgi:predicted lipid-binding transport protein (Tim44 family)
LGGLAAGFLGAGLFGLLFGHGFFGGMAGLASVLGLMLQIVLIVIIARMLFAWWQRKQMPVPAYAGGHRATGHSFSGLGGMVVGQASSGEPLTIGKADYDAFESLLGEIQSAYSAEDINALRTKVTPEMLSYFSEQLAENAGRGLVNKIDGVRLEQGDLAESWREGQVEYATVAMRFALADRMVDRVTGRAVEGGSPTQTTELWTFMRAPGGKWLLSAIQQT